MKHCIGCNIEKSEDEFSRKGVGLQSRCKICYTTYHREYYEKNKEKYLSKNRRNKNRQRIRLRTILLKAKQKPCQDCGKTFHPWVMELDHREESEKIEAVSNLVVHGCTDEKLRNEINKCEVVCANCHRMRTFNRLKNNNLIQPEILELITQFHY